MSTTGVGCVETPSIILLNIYVYPQKNQVSDCR